MDGGTLTAAGLRSQRVRLRDADEMAAAMRLWNMDCTQLGHDADARWILSGILPGIDFAVSSIDAHIAKGVTRPDQLALHLDIASAAARRISGHEISSQTVIVADGAAEFEYVSPGPHRAMSFNIPREAALQAIEGRSEGAIESRPGRLNLIVAESERIAFVRRLLADILDPAAGLIGESAELAAAELGDALIDLLLSPWRRDPATQRPAAYYQRLPIVRRAEAFMRANLGRPLMLHEICAAARASERSVAYGFQDVYGMGPKQYLRLLRLHMVRRDLKALPAEAASITDIAHRHGLWHMGHFSTAYRAVFGETAQQTRG